MAKTITAAIARYGLLGGDKLYQVRARLTLPYLVRQAKAGQTIYYSDLARELGIQNPRSFNYILGAIGNALTELADHTKTEIPPIQCIVINKQNELPGEGVGWFISRKDFGKLSKNQQKIIVDSELARVYTYQHWDWVLDQLSLEPLTINISEDLEKAKNFRGGGESDSHKRFKEFVSNRPELLGLKASLKNGDLEYKLPSADTVDIMFFDRELMIGVEAKSKISNADDILRGLFQCVKYKSLLEAEQIAKNKIPNCRVLLALEGLLPDKYLNIKNLLGIEVIEGIEMREKI
ncbi:hypothetical protein ATE47_01425 [Chryseobacterium sp. IHB B 17019]|nr:hypothetical protein ATE47_01425 [Chryseobacterium sp. IHB B 17019]